MLHVEFCPFRQPLMAIAKHSRVNSSTIVSIRIGRPSDVRSMTKS